MESLFFNTPNRRYQIEELFREGEEHLRRVDISNGIFFYDILLKESSQTIKIKNLDRMVMLIAVKAGAVEIEEHREKQTERLKENTITIYGSSRQDFSLKVSGEVFMLFVADFFLKRYLSGEISEPVDFLYEKLEEEVSLEKINTQPIDALSLYVVEKLLKIESDDRMKSIRAEHMVMEFMIHSFALIDIVDEKISQDERELAHRAKGVLLERFASPPTIKELAHLCATNESKLKKVFKKVYQSTINAYVQKLRMEEANVLLRKEKMTIGELATRVGYRHQGYFSKLFFETYGVYAKDLLKRG